MANTGVPVAAMAAAAWSWVEKMLQEAQRTSAPSACRVSISTAVWMVMCREPAIRAPFSGLSLPNSARTRHQARHFGLGDLDFLAAPGGEGDVLDDVVGHFGFLMRRRPLYRAAAQAPQHSYKDFFIWVCLTPADRLLLAVFLEF